MKYVRTRDGIFDLSEFIFEKGDVDQSKVGSKQDCYWEKGDGEESYYCRCILVRDIIKQADTIPELCDYCIYYNAYKDLVFKKLPLPTPFESLYRDLRRGFVSDIKLGILTDRGLIFIAKMNDEGDIVLK